MTMPSVVILAGGLGTRLMEETETKPKPMVEIGGLPILWHIMKIYATYGVDMFVVALGYKGAMIKDYFVNYHHRASGDLTCHLRTGETFVHNVTAEDWIVNLFNTGLHTQTGGRVKRVAQSQFGDETFMLTYGDGVADIDIEQLLAFHRSHGRLVTMTAVRPPARFGSISFDAFAMQDGDAVVHFEEKPQIGEGWINGGFFVLEPGVVDYIAGDDTLFEKEPLERLAGCGQLKVYCHDGFWQCMDTLRDVQLLESLWRTGDAPWKVWDND